MANRTRRDLLLLNFMKSVVVALDEPAVMIVAAEAPPDATKSPTKDRVERNHDDNEGKKWGAANEDDLGSLEHNNFLNFMNIIKLDASDNPAAMIVAAEESPVGKSPTKQRVERNDVDNEGKKRGAANEDDLGIGLVDCVAPAVRKVPAASYKSAYETPSNKEELDQNMAKSSDTIIEPAEKVCSEVIGGGEQPAKSNDIELHGGDLPGERRSSSVRELRSNVMTNSINTLVRNVSLYIVVE
jgi:hypothetical protein